MKWFKDFQGYVWFASIAVGAILWAFTTFATTNYVDAKHQSVQIQLSEIKLVLDRIDQRVYEMRNKR